MTLFCVIMPLDCSSAKGGQILLGQAMYSHQMDVSVLLPLELLATHVAGTMHVQLHVGVKLEKTRWIFVFELWARYLVLFRKSLLTSLLGTLVVCAVLSGQVTSEINLIGDTILFSFYICFFVSPWQSCYPHCTSLEWTILVLQTCQTFH